MPEKTVDEQVQELFNVPEVIGELISSKKEFSDFRASVIQLIKKLQSPSIHSQEIYDWLIRYILNSVQANKGLIAGIKHNEFILKSDYGILTDHENANLKKIVGEKLIKRVIEEGTTLIIDDLQSNRNFGDCRLQLENLMALSVLSDSSISETFAGLLILIGNKQGSFQVNEAEKTKFLFEVFGEQLIFAELKRFEIEKERKKLNTVKTDLAELDRKCNKRQLELHQTKQRLSKIEKELSKIMWRLGLRIVLAIIVAALLAFTSIWLIHIVASDFYIYAIFFTIIFAIILIAMGLLQSMEIGPAKAKSKSETKPKTT